MMSISFLNPISQLSKYLSFDTLTKRVSTLSLLKLAGGLAVGAAIAFLCYKHLKPKKPSQPASTPQTQPAENSVIVKAQTTALALLPKQGHMIEGEGVIAADGEACGVKAKVAYAFMQTVEENQKVTAFEIGGTFQLKNVLQGGRKIIAAILGGAAVQFGFRGKATEIPPNTPQLPAPQTPTLPALQNDPNALQMNFGFSFTQTKPQLVAPAEPVIDDELD
jgi:hypothetical protein